MSRTQITTRENLRKEDKSIKVVAGMSGLLGLWLIGTSVLSGGSLAHLSSALATGVVIAGLGGYNYYRKHNRESASRTASAVIGLLGLWVIASAFLFQVDGAAFWNSLVVGLLVAMTSVYNVGVSSIDTSYRLIQQSNERPPRTSRD